MRRRRTPALAVSLCLGLGLSCSGPGPEPEPEAPPQETAAPGATGGTVHEFAYLVPPVERLIGFLRGEGDLPDDVLADSVTLYVAPEGGGARVTRSAGELADRAGWRVDGHDLIPPSGHTSSTLSPGLHWNCQPMGLDTRYPELAALPHVGVKLAPGEGAVSCLQTWNATLVFDRDAATPRLTAVVYDQWEW